MNLQALHNCPFPLNLCSTVLNSAWTYAKVQNDPLEKTHFKLIPEAVQALKEFTFPRTSTQIIKITSYIRHCYCCLHGHALIVTPITKTETEVLDNMVKIISLIKLSVRLFTLLCENDSSLAHCFCMWMFCDFFETQYWEDFMN